MVKRMRDQLTATQEELVNDLNAAGTTVTNHTAGYTLHSRVNLSPG